MKYGILGNIGRLNGMINIKQKEYWMKRNKNKTLTECPPSITVEDIYYLIQSITL